MDNLGHRPVLSLSSAGMRMTRDEFGKIDDYEEIYDYELVDGVLVVKPSLDFPGADLCEEVGYWLRKYGESHPQGAALDYTLYGVYVGNDVTYRRTHRAVWTGLGRLPQQDSDIPSIVIEFVQPGRRSFIAEYTRQWDEYFALGVSEFWVFDRFRRQLTVFRQSADGPSQRELGRNDNYTTSLLPGFELSLSRLWDRGDHWTLAEEEAEAAYQKRLDEFSPSAIYEH